MNVGSCKYRRNRRDLLKTGEKPLVDSPEVDTSIYGDDNSLTAAPAPAASNSNSPQTNTNATGPRNINANGPRKSSRRCSGLAKELCHGTIECFCFSLLLMLRF